MPWLHINYITAYTLHWSIFEDCPEVTIGTECSGHTVDLSGSQESLQSYSIYTGSQLKVVVLIFKAFYDLDQHT